MDADTLNASAAMLLKKLVENPQDRDAIEAQLCAKIDEFHALGLPVPEALKKIETAMDQDAEDTLWDNMPV